MPTVYSHSQKKRRRYIGEMSTKRVLPEPKRSKAHHRSVYPSFYINVLMVLSLFPQCLLFVVTG